MMIRRLTLFALLLLVGAMALAQDVVPNSQTEFDPDAVISWPPPVYTLRGEIDIRGTAAIEGMTNYFIEFRPLEVEDFDPATTPEPTATPDDSGEEMISTDFPWFPVTLPSNLPVVDDVLGTWNTETTDDGLYEMRLTLNVRDLLPTYFIVSPLRIENNPPEFVVEAIAPPTSTPAPVTRPTLAPSPTAFDTTPMVTANTDANVREGDSTDYFIIGTLPTGVSARIIGISSQGSGWYYIELPEGRRGFIAPSIVTASGDIRNVPRINPPPPPYTPTPIPTNTPIASGNLAGSPPALNPNQPICNQQFEVLVNITNTGNAATSGEAVVLIQDVHVASGAVQATLTRTVPQLSPGQNWVAGGPMTVSTFYGEEHRIVVTIDVNGTVAETNETDNVLTKSYTLAQGGC